MFDTLSATKPSSIFIGKKICKENICLSQHFGRYLSAAEFAYRTWHCAYRFAVGIEPDARWREASLENETSEIQCELLWAIPKKSKAKRENKTI